MTEHATIAEASHARQQDCFLCILDPKHACYIPRLEGRLLAAVEIKEKGERVPMLLIDTGTERIEVLLEGHYYHSLVKELNARKGSLTPHQLKVRIEHLPDAPVTIAYGEKSRQRYQGNVYTLAVLEPDILLNITDLNQAEYCSRQYLLNRLIPSSTSPAMVQGNLIHYCFKEMLKEHDRGKFNAWSPFTTTPHEVQADRQSEASGDTSNASDNTVQESPLQAMQRHLEKAIADNAIDIALTDTSPEQIRADVLPHLESLAHWYESERNTLWTLPGVMADDTQGPEGDYITSNQVRAETFLIAPEIGLRGRLDLFWQHEGQPRLLELKTGKATNDLPKSEHRWQVLGYHALLAVRRTPRMKKAFATLLYSGTPQKAEAIGIRASIRDIQRVNERRSILILGRITGIASAPPGASRCIKCRMLEQCQNISSSLGWQQPDTQPTASYTSRRGQKHADASDTDGTEQQEAQQESIQTMAPSVPPVPEYLSPGQQVHREEDRQFFKRYFDLLQLEGKAGEQQQAQLWQQPSQERLSLGSSILGLDPQGDSEVQDDGWSQTFRCNNTSELREGDEILLSDGDPITGEVVSGTIMSISSEYLTVWTREKIAHPRLIDRYDSDIVHVRTLQNLVRWQTVKDAHLRDLVAERIHPRFVDEAVSARSDFNVEQNLAVERAMQMKDYLLIHGPPGTGKTSVIAEIVKRLVARKERVMLAGFTNQAVDNMVKRLEKEGLHDILRLGSERNVDSAVRPYLLTSRLAETKKQLQLTGTHTSNEQKDLIFTILYGTPIIASTTATWSSDRYAPKSAAYGGDTTGNDNFLFDVAIIDEAGQLTIPAILGALRFARRFILVGDEKQLPPLVLSKQAAEAGLNDSLFRRLKKLDDELQDRHAQEVSACVPLRTQYRMNKWISHFSSIVFYDKQLTAHRSVANRRIHYTSEGHASTGSALDVHKALDPKYPLVFLDIREEEGKADSDMKRSNAEARAIRELVKHLLARGIAPSDIGIIAPYRAQVANIRRHLFQADVATAWTGLPADTPLSVDTVDRFQGGERLVIIMSFATTQEPPLASPRREFLINPNRLNVALTRAQCKLILVGNRAALEQLPIFQRLIAYCASMHTIIEEREKVADQA